MHRLQGVAAVRETPAHSRWSFLLPSPLSAAMARNADPATFSLQQLFQQAQRASLVAQGLCCVIGLFYLLGFAPRVAENLAVTPA